MSDRLLFFAPCAPGFERVLLAEARALGLPKPEAQPGGVQFGGSLDDAMRGNLHLRSASRVLLTLSRFEAGNQDALYRGISEIPWTRFLGPEGTFAVQGRTKASALDHELFIEQRTKDAVADAFRAAHGRRPSVNLDDPDLRIHVRLLRDRATVSADTSGEPLFKRGWRKAGGGAPLKETLAAAIVLATEWDRRAPLLDPFCGSGTLLIEGALMAGNVAPGIFREDYAFRRWPGHDEKKWRAMREAARAAARPPGKTVIAGRDSNNEALKAARANLDAAGLAETVTVEQGDFATLPVKRGWNAVLVANPPYGERMGEERALGPLYDRFGRFLREQCGGYKAAILVGNPHLASRLGFPKAPRIQTQNGPIACELILVEVPR